MIGISSARSALRAARRLPAALARPAVLTAVVLGWALTVPILVATSAAATTIMAWAGLGTTVVGILLFHRHLQALHRRTTRLERRLRLADRKLDQVVARTSVPPADALAKVVSQATSSSVAQAIEGLRRSMVKETAITVTQATSKSVAHAIESLRRSMVKEVTTAYHELEALQNLYAMVPVDRRVPPMRGWAASPDLLLLLVELLRAERPRLMVECGSGASTLWAALAIRRFGLDTRLVALEHDATYAKATTDLLAAHGVENLAEVRHAPLEPVELDGGTWQWYARDGWADLDEIGLLFVDGPPGKTGPLARFPALPVLGDRLTGDAVVVLDDLIRADEQEIVKGWLAADPAVTDQRVVLEKGAAVLRRRSPTPGSWVGLPQQVRVVSR